VRIVNISRSFANDGASIYWDRTLAARVRPTLSWLLVEKSDGGPAMTYQAQLTFDHAICIDNVNKRSSTQYAVTWQSGDECSSVWNYCQFRNNGGGLRGSSSVNLWTMNNCFVEGSFPTSGVTIYNLQTHLPAPLSICGSRRNTDLTACILVVVCPTSPFTISNNLTRSVELPASNVFGRSK
jgi:hypothetical protein